MKTRSSQDLGKRNGSKGPKKKKKNYQISHKPKHGQVAFTYFSQGSDQSILGGEGEGRERVRSKIRESWTKYVSKVLKCQLLNWEFISPPLYLIAKVF